MQLILDAENLASTRNMYPLLAQRFSTACCILHLIRMSLSLLYTHFERSRGSCKYTYIKIADVHTHTIVHAELLCTAIKQALTTAGRHANTEVRDTHTRVSERLIPCASKECCEQQKWSMVLLLACVQDVVLFNHELQIE